MIIAGTGHRPDKLGGYSDEVYDKLVAFAEKQLLKFPQVDMVISGMALGWDQALAEAALNLGMPVRAYIPFIGMERKWPHQSQMHYHSLLRRIDEDEWVICSEEGYAPWKMQTRNERMANDCTTMLALWNGTSGGTANCIKYAEKINKPIINVWDQWISNKHITL